MTVFAVSEFMRTLFIILAATPFILLWGAAVLDLIRSQRSGWSIVGWMLVILAIPIIGPLVYLATRKPTGADVEHQHLAQQERKRAAGARPTGGLGF